jgi:hypothetical protein
MLLWSKSGRVRGEWEVKGYDYGFCFRRERLFFCFFFFVCFFSLRVSKVDPSMVILISFFLYLMGISIHIYIVGILIGIPIRTWKIKTRKQYWRIFKLFSSWMTISLYNFSNLTIFIYFSLFFVWSLIILFYHLSS